MNNTVNFGDMRAEWMQVHTAVIGSGAAGLNAAYSLERLGVRDVCIFTIGVNMGTSRNTGSDKQTYYKLSLGGSIADSTRQMAKDLFSGGCVDGDQALVEATLSSKSFSRLCELGVPFPQNEYGEYIGYQTDFDNTRRATSAGPLTSKHMHEVLWRELQNSGVRTVDGVQVIRILTHDGAVVGFIALRRRPKPDEATAIIVRCKNLVYAAGGPAGLYAKSVYPQSQVGATGIALEAGAAGKNLTEWQYGIASTKFRWNLSGTYQQVLPRYYSTDRNGGDERDFLKEGFSSRTALLNAIFMKGYQWPFNPEHLSGEGSSCIDLLIHREIVEKGRRVFLDYRRNPDQLCERGTVKLELAGSEAYAYLQNSRALQETPIERLCAMNQPAYELYLNHGIDLKQEALEIAVCAQHNNGGLESDANWESNLKHLYPVGEANGSHGVKRPGGSALNAGQTGALRAAQTIAAAREEVQVDDETWLAQVRGQAEEILAICGALLKNRGDSTVLADRKRLQERMSRSGAYVRSPAELRDALAETEAQLEAFVRDSRLASPRELCYAMQNRDLLIAQTAYLSAMIDYDANGGRSRGSFLTVRESGAYNVLGMRFDMDNKAHDGVVQRVCMENGKAVCSWRAVRPIPQPDEWFETVWKQYILRNKQR